MTVAVGGLSEATDCTPYEGVSPGRRLSAARAAGVELAWRGHSLC